MRKLILLALCGLNLVSCGTSDTDTQETKNLSGDCPKINNLYKTEYRIISTWNNYFDSGRMHYNVYMKCKYKYDNIYGLYVIDKNYREHVLYIIDDIFHKVGTSNFSIYIFHEQKKISIFHNRKKFTSSEENLDGINIKYDNHSIVFWSGFYPNQPIACSINNIYNPI